MTIKFSLPNLFSNFHSGEIDGEEFEHIIRDVVRKEYPDNSIEEIKYTKDKVKVILDNLDEIEIEIDQQEIIIT